ncbi:unnamed protein product [Prorocentrum cordatum]|uniref:Tubulin--tyrosine ligase-like protein 9 n=1 Tax=Prorocentrum cordatum TaxID=2364126 RepID=A0ABN9UJS1_9DINO|nr:unnamed protein product [Polarella glacialis]
MCQPVCQLAAGEHGPQQHEGHSAALSPGKCGRRAAGCTQTGPKAVEQLLAAYLPPESTRRRGAGRLPPGSAACPLGRPPRPAQHAQHARPAPPPGQPAQHAEGPALQPPPQPPRQLPGQPPQPPPPQPGAPCERAAGGPPHGAAGEGPRRAHSQPAGGAPEAAAGASEGLGAEGPVCRASPARPRSATPPRARSARARPCSATGGCGVPTSVRREEEDLDRELEAVEMALKRRNASRRDLVAAFLRKQRLDCSLKLFVFDGPDEHIRQALLREGSGWMENKLPRSAAWNLKWSVTDCESDYRDLQDGDLFNHFQNNRVLTTKIGLHHSLRQLAVEERVEIDAFFPRCYDLSNAADRDDFLMDFRRCAAVNLLRQHRRLLSEHGGAAESGAGGERAAEASKSGGYRCNVTILGAALVVLLEMLQELCGSLSDDESMPEGGRGLTRREWDAMVFYSELADAQLLRQAALTSEQPRLRNRRFTVAGFPLSAEDVQDQGDSCEAGCPRRAQRPLPLERWPEFCGHAWAQEPPAQLQSALETALGRLELAWGHEACAQGPANAWIVKPGTSSKGCGIMCMNQLPELLHHCKPGANRIVQKYIERPLLVYGGRKFDIRQWVLVRSFHPLEAYMFSECYLRLCNETYDMNDLANRQRHLTNWAINKHGNHAAEGAIASLSELQDILRTATGASGHWKEHLQPQLQGIVLQCLHSVRHSVVTRPQSFELYGFDFLIGEDLRPWLLEVNLSPACEARAPWLASMMSRMATRLAELLVGEGPFEPDGVMPDWVCVAAEGRVPDALAVGPAPTALGTPGEGPELDGLRPEDSGRRCSGSEGGPPPGDTASLCVVGRRLNLRSERAFDRAWKRQAAQQLINRVARGFLERVRLRRRRDERLIRLARLVQGRSRSFLAVRALQDLRRHLGAVGLQRRWRGALGRRRACERRLEVQRNLAATRLQRCWRGRAARRWVGACVRLVRWWRRRHRARAACAVRVQSAARGWLARRRYARYHERVLQPTLTLSRLVALARWRHQAALCSAGEAAVLLQRRWRGLLGRRAAARQRTKRRAMAAWRAHAAACVAAARRLQRSLRCRLRRAAAARWASARQAARLRLQRGWRARAARRLAAAVVLQAGWRALQARRHAHCLRRARAALALQAAVRGLWARRAARQRLARLVAMQAVWRGRLGRRMAVAQRRLVENKRRWLESVRVAAPPASGGGGPGAGRPACPQLGEEGARGPPPARQPSWGRRQGSSAGPAPRAGGAWEETSDVYESPGARGAHTPRSGVGASEDSPAHPICARRGCTMVLSDYVKGGQLHYVCDLCGGRSCQGHVTGTTRRWRCGPCDYDVCFRCCPQAPAPAAPLPSARGRPPSPRAARPEAAGAAGGRPQAAPPPSGGSALSAARHLRASSARHVERPRVPASDASGESGDSAEPAGPARDRGRPRSAAPSAGGGGARAYQRSQGGRLPGPWRSSSAGVLWAYFAREISLGLLGLILEHFAAVLVRSQGRLWSPAEAQNRALVSMAYPG